MGFVGLIDLVHEDARRAIAEFNTDDWDFSVQRFATKERIPLGNHYHVKKDEIFVILKGGGSVATQRVKEPESRETFSLKIGSVIYVPKNMAHTFELEPGSEMICFSTKAFDKDDMHPLVLAK